MEDLSKTQVVLLCILVSFVISIGTGIITFSLLSEAPPEITQTINRVVEHTIERVVSDGDSKTITKEVIVSEGDLIVDAINKNTDKIVWVRDGNGKLLSIGVVVSKTGLIVADGYSFNGTIGYSAVFSDGKSYPLSVVSAAGGYGPVFFRIIKQDNQEFTAGVLGDSELLALGQMVIGISGADRIMVATGRVSGFVRDQLNPPSNDKTGKILLINTDLALKDESTGGPLLNLSGQIVGFNIATSASAAEGSFIPINVLGAAIAAAEAKK